MVIGKFEIEVYIFKLFEFIRTYLIIQIFKWQRWKKIDFFF